MLHDSIFRLNFELYNSPKKTIQSLTFKFALFAPPAISNLTFEDAKNASSYIDAKRFIIDGGTTSFFLLDEWIEMAPGERKRMSATVYGHLTTSCQCSVQIITATEPPVEFPFRMERP